MKTAIPYLKILTSTKIQQNHIKKLRLILAKLNVVTQISDMNFPGSGLHPLKETQLS